MASTQSNPDTNGSWIETCHSLTRNPPKVWWILWTAHIPTRWKILLWKMYYDTLPIGRNRCIRNIEGTYDYLLCQITEETTHHLFKECDFAKLIWQTFPLAIKIDSNPGVPWPQWIRDWILLLHLHRTQEYTGVSTFVAVAWSIWCFANRALFETLLRNPLKLVDILQHNLHTLQSLREHALQDRQTVSTPIQSKERTRTMTWGTD